MKQPYNKSSDPNRTPVNSKRARERRISASLRKKHAKAQAPNASVKTFTCSLGNAHDGEHTSSPMDIVDTNTRSGVSKSSGKAVKSEAVDLATATAPSAPQGATSHVNTTSATPTQLTANVTKLDNDVSRGLSHLDRVKNVAELREDLMEYAKAAFRDAKTEADLFIARLYKSQDGTLSPSDVIQLKKAWDKTSATANDFLGQLISCNDTAIKGKQEVEKLLRYADDVRKYAVQNHNWFEQTQKHYAALYKKMEERDVEVKKLDVEAEKLKMELAKKVEERDIEVEKLKMELARKAEEHDKEIRELKEEKQVLREDVNAYKDLNTRLTTDRDAAEAEVRELKSQVAGVHVLVGELGKEKEKAAKQQARIEAMEKALREGEADAAELAKGVSAAQTGEKHGMVDEEEANTRHLAKRSRVESGAGIPGLGHLDQASQ
ncbi:hypothetical protein NA57DRAFT_77399 [Rhizodiscina lignyota]|uniref:Uncharacterized protein n=1 Tax=Rhizodiscina lignyota TaxID=1504668 RepID=A0A9P4IDQ9_9PEZI|nr:hypothetical protein NA57DRAFT_77399 [Rhizodiscina lignyota]